MFNDLPQIRQTEAVKSLESELSDECNFINFDEKVRETIDGKVVTFPYNEEIKIHIGSGNKEDRPVVKFNVEINGERYENVPFSIADRSENEYKALLGEEFIKANGGIVDATKED
jgi:hypothetical protein